MTKLIIDTDLGFDCDDAGALALANIMMNQSELEILAVTHSVNKKIGGCAIKKINEYYHNPDIIVGVADRYAINVDCFFEEFYEGFEQADTFQGWGEKPSFYKLLKPLELEEECEKTEFKTATEVMAKALQNSADKEVTILCIGQANNLADMMAHEDGMELLKKKVKKIVIMCGNFSDYEGKYLCGDLLWPGEFNVILDIPSSQKVFSCMEIPIYVLDFYQGWEVLTGESLREQKDNPVYQMYYTFRGEKLVSSSWDILALLYASEKYDNMFDCSQAGRVHIDDYGKSTFQEGEGSHYLLTLNRTSQEYEKLIDKHYQKRRKEK